MPKKQKNLGAFLTPEVGEEMTRIFAKSSPDAWMSGGHGKYTIIFRFYMNQPHHNYMGLSMKETRALQKQALPNSINEFLKDSLLSSLSDILDRCESDMDRGQAIFNEGLEAIAQSMTERWEAHLEPRLARRDMPKKYLTPKGRRSLALGIGRARGFLNYLNAMLVFADKEQKDSLGLRLIPWMRPSQGVGILYLLLVVKAITEGRDAGDLFNLSEFDPELFALSDLLQEDENQVQYMQFCEAFLKAADRQVAHFCAADLSTDKFNMSFIVKP